MCGRYSLFALASDVEDRFGATFEYSFEPRYNAAPSQSLHVVTNEDPETIQRLEWGLVPSWADDRSQFGLINARAETLTDKPSFREAAERRRCVVPADGYYEWAGTDSGSEPYRITRPDESLFGLAGLWERWEPTQRQAGLGQFGDATEGLDEDPVVETFAIVTTEPNDAVAEVHDRMPVVLDPTDVDAWLHGDSATRRELAGPYAGDLRTDRVSRRVNDPANDSPAVVEPVAR